LILIIESEDGTMTTYDKNLCIDGTPIIRMENDLLQVDVAPSVDGRVINFLPYRNTLYVRSAILHKGPG
jgi:hypothetical protein